VHLMMDQVRMSSAASLERMTTPWRERRALVPIRNRIERSRPHNEPRRPPAPPKFRRERRTSKSIRRGARAKLRCHTGTTPEHPRHANAYPSPRGAALTSILSKATLGCRSASCAAPSARPNREGFRFFEDWDAEEACRIRPGPRADYVLG
jgi:hypothetical protein